VETVTVKPLRIFQKTASGLVELHGEAAEKAVVDFWAADDHSISGEVEL
jgi:hypothetical protein